MGVIGGTDDKGPVRSRNPPAGPTNWPFRKPMPIGGVVWKGACAVCPPQKKITLILIIFKVKFTNIY